MRILLFSFLIMSNLGVFSQLQKWHYGVSMGAAFFEVETPNFLVEKRLSPDLQLYAERMIGKHFSINTGLGYFSRNYQYNIFQYFGLIPSAKSSAYHLALPLNVTIYPLKNRRMGFSAGIQQTFFLGYQFTQLTDFQGEKLPEPLRTRQFLWNLHPSKFPSPFDVRQFYRPRWQVSAQYRLPLYTKKLEVIAFCTYSNDFHLPLPNFQATNNLQAFHFGIKLGK